MKMCIIVLSTNRPEYLIPTLDSFDRLDFSGIEVTKLLVDDYPLGRDDDEVRDYAKAYKFDALILRKENLGITANWTDLWRSLAGDDFDYVFMHEDDAVHIKSVKVMDMIDFLKEKPSITQVQFGRSPWYGWEGYPNRAYHTKFRNHQWERSYKHFTTMASVFSMDIVNEGIQDKMGYDLAEGTVAWYLRERQGRHAAIFRGAQLEPLIQHIGDYSQGKRVSQEGDPGWNTMGHFKEGIKYCSKTGVILEDDTK